MARRGQGDDDDEALWAKVAGTASPLKRGRDAVVPPKPAKVAAPVPKAKPQRPAPVITPVPKPVPKPAHVPRAAPLDRQTSRQLDKGKLEVEARLDLHGMRQRDAHAQLRRFLKTAQARGLKHVLVITGKGADQAASRSFYAEDERGVLRNAVPHWLSGPDFATLVVSYSQAPRRLSVAQPNDARAEQREQLQSSMADRVLAHIPEIEGYIAGAMRAFDIPGLAIGIVGDDRLVYAKGFGVRSKSGGQPVDTRTLFQIGSTTKAFLAATEAIMVDRGKLRWDDRVVDLDPEFQLKDPWVTREFRVFDLLAQRSSLPGFVNDMLAMYDFDDAALIRSLRNVEPVSSFRTTFAYTNITHLLASRVVAKAAGSATWNTVLQQELLDPLGMKDSSYTAEAIEAAANHANGHRWTPEGSIEAPFTPIFPYHLGGAGDINTNVDDMARWVRLQLGNGTFEGRRIVSPENLAYTRRPMVAVTDQVSYAQGWFVFPTPGGNILWHDGDALIFGSFVGLIPDRSVGVVIFTNTTDNDSQKALGLWILDRLLGNPKVDYVANSRESAKASFETKAKLFAKPANPRPFPPLAPLAGTFVNPSFGEATVEVDGDSLVMEIQATGAKLKLEPWDGNVFVASLMPTGRFGPIVDLGYMTKGFVQFQMGKDGKLDQLRLSAEDGQAYAFARQ